MSDAYGLSRAIPASDQGEEDETFDHHFRGIMQSLKQLRSQGMLTDLIISSGSTTIKAHKCVLAAGSKYFRACFTNSMIESESTDPLELNNIDESSLEAVIDYIYTGRIYLSDANYLQILDAANQLELPKLVEKCCKFLLSNLDISNCLAIHDLSEQYLCYSLSAQAELFIFRNFERIIETEDFIMLSFDRLSAYLSRDELSMPSEEAVFESVVKWIGHEQHTRSCHIGPLLSRVRMELISTRYIAQFIHKYVHINGECEDAMQLVLAAYQWHCLPESEKPNSWKHYLRSKAIYPTLYIFGGDDGVNDSNPYSMVMHLDKNQQEWIGAAAMGSARSVGGSASIDNKLYVVGGFDGERAMDSAEVFDCVTNTWSLLPPLLQRRCSCSCAVLRGQLYVVGGVCGPMALSHVERFDNSVRKWISVSPLSETRSACGVASMGDNIYVVGGINSHGATICTGEVYNYVTQQWREISPMVERRRSLALCVLNGKVYAVGGNNGAVDLRTVEEYSPSTNKWRSIKNMCCARMYCSATPFNGEIYAAGGVDESNCLNSIEKYDPRTGLWTPFSSLPRMMCGSGMQVLDSVPSSLAQPSRKRKALYVDAGLLGPFGLAAVAGGNSTHHNELDLLAASELSDGDAHDAVRSDDESEDGSSASRMHR